MTSTGARDTAGSRTRVRVHTVGLAVAAAAYCWIAAGFHPFTWPMRVMVAIPVLAAFASTWFAPLSPRTAEAARPAAYRRCVAVWLALLVAAIAWELTALFSSPRDDHPTLSSIADDVMSTHPGRAATYALWLVVGWLLFVRPVARRT